MFKGLDLKNKLSWLFGVYGFATGFLMGILWSDLNNAIGMGIIFALAPLYQGGINYRKR